MTDAHRRDTGDLPQRPRGSSAFGRGGQPLADQPTEVVPLDRYEFRDNTPAAGVPAATAPLGTEHPADRSGDRGSRRAGSGMPGDGHRGADPQYTPRPVAVRRADPVAGLLLVLAGIAAGVSLLLVWVPGGPTGLDQVRAGFADLAAGTQWSTGSWRPLAVVLGGAALLLLGLLMYVPARAHRFLGMLALLVSLVVGAGVLVPLADAGWNVSGFAVGTWFTAAVGGLGLLGALKALSTGPRTPRS